MSFFSTRQISESKRGEGLGGESLRRLECKVCPLAKVECTTPNMPASGADEPWVYFLGEAPGQSEDSEGRAFVGKSGRLLRDTMSDEIEGRARFSNTVRCRPPKNRTPTMQEIECCRPSVERDIAETKPRVIVAVGGTAFSWFAPSDIQSDISLWRGRCIPVRVRDHECWLVPTLHPSYILRQGGKSTPHYHLMKLDLQLAERVARKNIKAKVATVSEWLNGIDLYTGSFTTVRDKLSALLQRLAREDVVAFDYETTTLESGDKNRRIRPFGKGAEILCVSFASAKEVAVVPIAHPKAGFSKMQKDMLLDLLRGFMMDSKTTKVAHNLPFELEWTGFMLGEDAIHDGKFGDTMAMAYSLDCRRGAKSLEAQTYQHFGLSVKSIIPVNIARLAQEPLDDVLRYCGLDSKVTYRLYHRMAAMINREGLTRVYEEQIERARCLVITQLRGNVTDKDVTAQLAKQDLSEIDKLATKFNKSPDVKKFVANEGPFSPNSTPNCVTLINRYIKGIKLDGSANEAALKALKHPAADMILLWRQRLKNHSTYIQGLAENGKYMWPDGKLHPQYNTMLTQSRRLSSEGPNAQNFPRRKSAAVRGQFVAPRGHKFISVDYGQLEARVVVMTSKDKAMTAAIKDGYDVHSHWVKEMEAVNPSYFKGMDDKEKRTVVKASFVFASFYGAQFKSIAYWFNISEQRAAKLHDKFWNMFAGVKEWQNTLFDSYTKKGYVEYPTGFRRTGLLSQNQLYNSPIQGTASDIVLEGMVALSKRGLTEDKPYLQAVMNVHDELNFYVPEKKVDSAVEIIVSEMLKPRYTFMERVPLAVEVSVGDNWCEMADYGDYQT